MSTPNENKRNVGTIVEIKGVVLDAVFPDELPVIYTALRISLDGRELIAEVQQHLGDDRVRAVAMDSTTASHGASTSWTPGSRSPSPSASRRSAGCGT